MAPAPFSRDAPDGIPCPVDTQVRLKDSQTLVIGGLIQNAGLYALLKVPFLGDLPFFGHLFRHTQKSRSTSEIVILLKASAARDYEGVATSSPNLPSQVQVLDRQCGLGFQLLDPLLKSTNLLLAFHLSRRAEVESHRQEAEESGEARLIRVRLDQEEYGECHDT